LVREDEPLVFPQIPEPLPLVFLGYVVLFQSLYCPGSEGYVSPILGALGVAVAPEVTAQQKESFADEVLGSLTFCACSRVVSLRKCDLRRWVAVTQCTVAAL
jgi:hypothetical protein